jgi:DNA repair exonuclease SbcCD ATPase subunit
LRAEVLLDAITRITGTEDRFALSPPGTRAVQIHSGEVSTYFLTTFGRAPRQTACSCEVNREANLSQALHLLNGDTITAKVAQGKTLPALIAAKKTPEGVVEELYVLALSRKPTEAELKGLAGIVRRETSPDRLEELAELQLKADAAYQRVEERLKSLKADLAKLPKDSKEAAALGKQVANLEQNQAAARKRLEATAVRTVYGDILWGLFNSAEFAFNH